MIRITGYLIAFSVLLLGIMLGGELHLFIDYPSLAITLGAGFGFCFAVHSPRELISALRVAAADGDVSREAFQRHDPVLETFFNTSIAAGVLGTLIGCVNMLANMDDPKSIGPAFAVALLTLLYSAVIAGGLILPLRGRLRSRVVETVDAPKGPSAALPATFTILMIFAFWTMLTWNP